MKTLWQRRPLVRGWGLSDCGAAVGRCGEGHLPELWSCLACSGHRAEVTPAEAHGGRQGMGRWEIREVGWGRIVSMVMQSALIFSNYNGKSRDGFQQWKLLCEFFR